MTSNCFPVDSIPTRQMMASIPSTLTLSLVVALIDSLLSLPHEGRSRFNQWKFVLLSSSRHGDSFMYFLEFALQHGLQQAACRGVDAQGRTWKYRRIIDTVCIVIIQQRSASRTDSQTMWHARHTLQSQPVWILCSIGEASSKRDHGYFAIPLFLFVHQQPLVSKE
jgi:hypothetical protein